MEKNTRKRLGQFVKNTIFIKFDGRDIGELKMMINEVIKTLNTTIAY